MTKSELAGAILVVVSVVLYTAILGVPWLVESTSERVTYAAGLAISGEVAFWLGALIAGQSVVRRYRAWLSPVRWFRRRAADSEELKTE